MSGSVLVTGAAGFVGSHLLDWLHEQGERVVAWRRPTAEQPRAVGGATWMEVELLDRDGVAAALADVQPSAVYHLAGAAHVAQSWQHVRETYEGNVLATHNLIEALRYHRLKPRLLIACSAHVYAPKDRQLVEEDDLRPSSPYATSKLATEMLATRAWLDDGIPTLIARAFNHVGPRQDPSYVAPSIARQIALIEQGHLEPVLTTGNLEPRRDLTDVRDTVKAYRAMMQHAQPGLPYNVASTRAIAVRDLVNAFVGRARREVRVVQDPSRFRPHDVPLLVGSHDRLTRDTAWQPRIPFDQTIDDLLAYWRARIAAGS